MSEHNVNGEINRYLDKARQASAVFNQLGQDQTDRIVRAAYRAGLTHRVMLAKAAAEETGIGKWEDKVLKNVVATQYVYEDIKDLKTAGIISEDFVSGITEIAQPIGPILGVIPSTNPTSTVMFKILIALKTRNPIILTFHPRAEKCCSETARILYEAALAEDAPEECVQWVLPCSRETTSALMRDGRLALILATGGEGLVHAAYSSGTPALGVGPGNVPVYSSSRRISPLRSIKSCFLRPLITEPSAPVSRQLSLSGGWRKRLVMNSRSRKHIWCPKMRSASSRRRSMTKNGA